MNDQVVILLTVLLLLVLFWMREQTLPPVAAPPVPELPIFTVTIAARARDRSSLEDSLGYLFGRRGRFVIEEGEQAFIEAVKRAYQ